MDLMQRIKHDIRIEDYLAGRGYHILPHGRGYLRLKEHDSLIIDPEKNRFWWNSAGVKGSIIDLVMALDGVSQEDAIRSLAKQLYGQRPPQRTAPAPKPRGRCRWYYLKETIRTGGASMATSSTPEVLPRK